MTYQSRSLSDAEIDAVAGGPFMLPIGLQLLLSIKGCQDGPGAPAGGNDDAADQEAETTSDTGEANSNNSNNGSNGNTGGSQNDER